MGVLLACISVHHGVSLRPEEGNEYLETRVIGACELACGYWEWNMGLERGASALHS